MKKPIQYRTDRCKDLNAENTVCPINQKMMDMDNVKLNSSIHVFMYRIKYCIAIKLMETEKEREKGRIC